MLPQVVRQDPWTAVLAGDRLVFVSPAFADRTGYTPSELLGPEFRASILFDPPPPSLALEEVGDVRSRRVTLRPLRGEPLACTVTLLLLEVEPVRLFAMLVDTGAEPASDDLAPAVARAAVSGVRSALAREITALRRVQERVEALELAHAEHLRGHLRELAHVHEELALVEEARRRLERRLAGVRAR